MGSRPVIPPSGDLPQVTIRPARAGDSPRLAVLCEELWYPTSVEEVERRLGQIQMDEEHCVHVAETADGAVVGWVYVYLIRSLLHEPHAEIGGLIVAEGYRGQRIGELLLKQAEDWAGERGCCAVSVHSNVIRKDAHRFYERLGYKVIKTQLALRRELRPTE